MKMAVAAGARLQGCRQLENETCSAIIRLRDADRRRDLESKMLLHRPMESFLVLCVGARTKAIAATARGPSAHSNPQKSSQTARTRRVDC